MHGHGSLTPAHERVAEQLAARFETIVADLGDAQTAGVGATIRRGQARRYRRRRIAVVASGAMLIGATIGGVAAVRVNDGRRVSAIDPASSEALSTPTDGTAVAVPTAVAPIIVESRFDWQPRPDAQPVMAGYRSIPSADGALYAIGTMPAVGGYTEALYRSADGLDWGKPVPIPEPVPDRFTWRWNTDAAALDGSLYAVGTAPSSRPAADGTPATDLVIRRSDDLGSTYTEMRAPGFDLRADPDFDPRAGRTNMFSGPTAAGRAGIMLTAWLSHDLVVIGGVASPTGLGASAGFGDAGFTFSTISPPTTATITTRTAGGARLLFYFSVDGVSFVQSDLPSDRGPLSPVALIATDTGFSALVRRQVDGAPQIDVRRQVDGAPQIDVAEQYLLFDTVDGVNWTESDAPACCNGYIAGGMLGGRLALLDQSGLFIRDDAGSTRMSLPPASTTGEPMAPQGAVFGPDGLSVLSRDHIATARDEAYETSESLPAYLVRFAHTTDGTSWSTEPLDQIVGESAWNSPGLNLTDRGVALTVRLYRNAPDGSPILRVIEGQWKA